MTEDTKQKNDGWYEKGETLTDKWLRNGYIPNWFRWIEWVTLTCVLITAAIKATNNIGQVVLGAAAGISILFIYFSGMNGFNTLVAGHLKKYKLDNDFGFFVVMLLAFLIPTVILVGLVTAILGLVPQ
ncbi:hypothetical protein [Microbulbifer sp. THAF38]|uniref:hypothetical protein n=1 Tax=Microbulbifer sp. THAF38 TaxID=2587856 RepID=UPI001269487C|nr:hypothetical protein [Microbulbifer sp. THAF38]QFT56477.1 hypothetical protein FIU95_18170 [Microbulbifer sp. THAF38]